MVFVRRTSTVSYNPLTPQFQQLHPNSRTKLQYRKLPTKSLTRAKTFDFLQNRPQQNPVRTITKTELVSLSLDDIYNLAERERLTYSARKRREAVELAQSKTHKFDEFVSSRPHTSASRYINEVRRDAMTPKSIRSEPVPSRANSRVDTTDFDDEDEESIYPMNDSTSLPVGRECCEIIGPQVCSQCKQSQTRQIGLESCDNCFPTLRVSHENMTTAAVLQRYLPDLSERDIQDKIARGEIAKPRLLLKRYSTKHNQHIKKEEKNESETNRQINQSKSLVPTSSMFFVNIRDLNAKIVSGQLHRAIGFSEKVQKEIMKRQENRRKISTPTKKPEPEAVQPKERLAKFDPDILLSLSMQTNEPSFFAGRKNEYELPERLPDPIRFADLRDKRPVNLDSNSEFQLYGLEEEPEDEEVADFMS